MYVFSWDAKLVNKDVRFGKSKTGLNGGKRSGRGKEASMYRSMELANQSSANYYWGELNVEN